MIIPELKGNLNCSRLDQQHNTGMLQTTILPEDERRELRIWMRRKQRERLAVYQKHRESLREREHKPFTAFGTVVRNGCLFTRTADLACIIFSNIISTLFTCNTLCRNQQREIERSFGEPEKKKKGTYSTCLHYQCT